MTRGIAFRGAKATSPAGVEHANVGVSTRRSRLHVFTADMGLITNEAVLGVAQDGAVWRITTPGGVWVVSRDVGCGCR